MRSMSSAGSRSKLTGWGDVERAAEESQLDEDDRVWLRAVRLRIQGDNHAHKDTIVSSIGAVS